MSFAELKRGLVAGTWRSDSRTGAFLLVLVGSAALLAGVFLLVGWLTRPVGFAVASVAVAVALGRTAVLIARA
jgi:hypothetical protein